MEYHDYYKTLGLSREASQDEIKKQYRRLARKYHPDVSKEDNAEQRFKEIAEAYEVLKDPEKRRSYDQLGANWKAGQEFRPPPGWEQAFGGGSAHFGAGMGGAGGFSDFFESVFGGNMGAGGFRAQPQKPASQTLRITIRLKESYAGGKRTIQIPEYGTNGQPTGQHRKLEIRIPKGIMPGQKIRLSKQGPAHTPGGTRGDLLLEIRFEEHPLFKLDERNILLTLPITPWEAALGSKVTVPTLGGRVELKVAAGAQSGQKMRLKGRGLPGKQPGDQIITLLIQVPPADSEEMKQLYQQMRERSNFSPRDPLQAE